MKFNKSDLIQMENLIKITRKGQFTLDGLEVLAFSDCIKWLAGMQQLVKQQIEDEEKPKPIIPEPVKDVISIPESRKPKKK